MIDIADNKAHSFLEFLNSVPYIKAKRLSASDAAALQEISHI